MRELPILFSTPMVQAILENRKTMTRRTYGLEKVNAAPDTWEFEKISQVRSENGHELMVEFQGVLGNGDWMYAFSRYNIGDIMWVRETFFDARKLKDAPLFANGPDFYYRADKDAVIGCYRWKASLFMPREACRLKLEVTAVRCERLLDITDRDSLAEGMKIERIHFTPRSQFFQLWEKLNGIESVESNPWVFVYEFKKL